MASYKVLVGNEGTYGSPVTHSDFVFFNDGETLTQKMDIFSTKVNDVMYPVGRIIETVGSFNPNGHYPGQWVRLPKHYGLMTEGNIALQGVDANGKERPAPFGLTLLDGSEWDMIYHHEVSGGYWATIDQCLDYDLNPANTTKFGRMRYVDNYYNDQHLLEFLMVWNVPYGGGTEGEPSNMGRWVQNSSPFSGGGHNKWNVATMAGGYNSTTTITAADGTTTTNTDIQRGLYVPWAGVQNWTGLGRRRPNALTATCYFCGNRGMNDWFYAIGSTEAYGGGIPAHFGKAGASACTLYVRRDNAVLHNLNAGALHGEQTHILTVDEMPQHDHRLGYTRTGNFTNLTSDNAHSEVPDSYYTGPTGKNMPHNNMQPSIYINLWERIS